HTDTNRLPPHPPAHKKGGGPCPTEVRQEPPPHRNYCGSHLLSHNHQVAVPSARMGLATRIGTVSRACPHHYHHRNTNQTTTANTTASRQRSKNRTKNANNTMQATNHPTRERPMPPTSTQKNSHAHTNPQGLMSDRCISTSQLHTSQCFHTRPINPIIYRTPHPTKVGRKSHLGAGFPLRCFQRLSIPNVANQPCSWRNNWHTRGSSVPVLSY